MYNFSSRVETIKEKRRLMNMKLILIKYNLPSDALSTPREAVLNIVRHNSSSKAVDDALLVAENFKCISKLDCFYFRLTHFLTDSQVGITKISACFSLLRIQFLSRLDR